ncbi:hypothetical protein HUZ36_18500 [Pseudoalteromonas sp. McH1-7]|uniref:Uncharacterized protein n=1 Tax=Pseudoalteromonas peptidolytica F12-50-A1 TaxID=1315280 RepID=A0A8I0MV82_9GAMM|nr:MULTISPECIES: hypothetical protein [Pseudoalteromonas]MBE0345794.1 hypothetical protein [Pseudoalteromonas peptidolytica F12-50-A1]MDW7547882.1 hypothetical protein [Pseudoalteromonas peptidolytica]NLR14404.1 hypothetical protein [Pseudoalteromonas peptidolytica]NUZ12773.1 hypothetical protein [Pseudoalteromonas sp. McH1-7]RRS07425.1 hypothetical protein EAG18_16870 [Pseudoalteromonas sp. J010]
MYFRLSQIAQLDEFKLREKQMILRIALSHLDAKTKVLLRIAKLILLTPFFASLVVFEGWLLLPVLFVAGLIYPLLTTPLEIYFGQPKLTQAITEFTSAQKVD